MSINVVWDNNEKTIMRYVYDGPWSWEDFHAAQDQAEQMMDGVDYKVNIIVDVRASSLLPQNALSRGNRVAKAAHRNQGRTVIVGANALIRSVHNIWNKVYGKSARDVQISFVNTMDEAHERLDQRATVEH